MRKTILTLFIAAVFAFVVTCGGGDDNNGGGSDQLSRNLPSKLSVTVPSSLNSSSPGGKAGGPGAEGSMGYQQMKMITGMMKMNSQNAQMYLLIIDQLMSNVKDKNGECVSGLSVSMDGAIKAAIKEQMTGMGMSEQEVNDMLSQMPSSMPAPPMKYDSQQVVGYDNEIIFYPGSDMNQQATCDTLVEDNKEVIQWTGKSKIKMTMNHTMEMGPGMTNSASMTFTYDDDKKVSTFVEDFKENFDGEQLNGSVNMTLMQCSATDNADNCVKVKATMKFVDGDNNNDTYTIEGKADDNGGFLETSFVYNGTAQKSRDYFDGTGASKGYQVYNDSTGEWDLVEGAVPGGYDDYETGHEMTGAPTVDVSGLTLPVNDLGYIIVLDDFLIGDPDPALVVGFVNVFNDGSADQIEVAYWGTSDMTGLEVYAVTSRDPDTGEPTGFSQVTGTVDAGTL
ncbi:MAG: hypothetical protein GY754_34080 [bacterium]|nr:hypothetical protein [bacterium]